TENRAAIEAWIATTRETVATIEVDLAAAAASSGKGAAAAASAAGAGGASAERSGRESFSDPRAEEDDTAAEGAAAAGGGMGADFPMSPNRLEPEGLEGRRAAYTRRLRHHSPSDLRATDGAAAAAATAGMGSVEDDSFADAPGLRTRERRHRVSARPKPFSRVGGGSRFWPIGAAARQLGRRPPAPVPGTGAADDAAAFPQLRAVADPSDNPYSAADANARL
ncbi:MAG TPA: hypothetical protein VJB02_00365, partial [Coxiellaceae bacterium]|nr:hypothetical protein [Coxiellaceae bacterium]